MSLVVGIDTGTQSVKLVVYDPVDRRVVATHGQALELIARDDGVREQHPEWWIEAIRACFAKLDPALRARVAAIGVSGQQHGFVPLDAAGKVLAPAKLWCDTSTQAECEEIMDAVGGAQQCVELAGNPILAGYTASKLPWTRKHRPEAYARLASILLPHDYVNFWLTGERWMEYGDASGTGWLDVRTRQWSKPMLAATDSERDLSALLPPLVAADAEFHHLAGHRRGTGLAEQRSRVRRRWRQHDGCYRHRQRDTWCAQHEPRYVRHACSLTPRSRSWMKPADWAAFCSSTGGWLPLICTMNCTVATEAVAQAFGFNTRDGDAVMAATTPGANGLVMLPFFNGERTPDLPHARGGLFNLDLNNFTRANVYRAAMEGATYALRNGYDLLQAAGMTFDAIRLTGGGSHSAAWRQMVADVFALPVEVPVQAEGAALGAALQALWALEKTSNANADLAAIAREHVQLNTALAAHPDAQAVAAYRPAYRQFLRHLDGAKALHAERQPAPG